MPWYLYIAIRHTFPKGKRLPFFTIMSVTGVVLGTLALVVVLSVFNGFGHAIREVVADTTGDLKVMNGRIFEDYEDKIDLLTESPLVDSAAPSTFGMVMLQAGNRPIFPQVQGIEVDRERKIVPLDDYIRYGNLDELDDDSVLISSGIANTLRIRVGDEVDIYTPLMIERLKQDEVLLPRLMRVAAVFETGFTKIDENTVITTLRTMQDLYGLGDGVHAIKVKLKPGVDADFAARELQGKFEPPFRVSTWLESNADYLAIIEFEKRMMFFILLIIVLVASFSIATSLFTSVVKKTREIGLFTSMGATSQQIIACFCLQGFSVGVVGTAIGFALSFALLSARETIIDAIFSVIGGKEQTMQFYFFSELPVHYKPVDLIVIAVLSISIATLAGLVPSIKAGLLKPVEALRSE
ncbi:ABC transporter permease [Pelagicoccus sp. SDUM812002]|uniref:ABC transporter permease n=1 Tax=Pelagicoccus sp. SDUM812002 TaxID=3041266 RepID=UPI00280DC5CD|nr:ABC transporter permease [Pelagicoccus sp. SDUM812002]MDQ8185207.1 ABC transporter permease [Pelagicoccus sp. SDUM812002]